MSTKNISKYGFSWKPSTHPLQIELYCIKNRVGNVAEHYENARKIIWPHLDDHRWHKLCLEEMARSKVTVLAGAGSSGKTHEAAWFGLVSYWANPNETLVLVSSTDISGLRRRVWGEVTKLWEFGKLKFNWLAGNLIDSRIAIATDDIDDDSDAVATSRDMRKGIVGIPNVQGGKQVGLQKWVGIKQKNILLIADEAQFMGASFLSAFANLNNNENFSAIVLGNPVELLDPLGRAAEPKDGWSSHMNPANTCVWDTRFMGGRCVNLVGTDSPNFDYPETEPPKFKYLVSRDKIKETVSFFGMDSIEYFSQCVGTFRVGVMSRRVLSRDLCSKFNAFDPVVWRGEETIKIAGLDAAYSGDRCVCGHVEFGKCSDGKIRLKFNPPAIVPISASGKGMDAEEQIAKFVKSYCLENGIPPENFYHDSTGRGSLGTALAREWSALCNPVEFGGAPTTRPVTADTYINDPVDGRRRLKLAKEHYSKFVTELWFAVRYAIEADQIRNLPEDVMDEFCMREWRRISGDRIELEAKREMKERVGRSPDLADFASICLEGARRKGFSISKLGSETSIAGNLSWLSTDAKKRFDWNRSKMLDHK